MKFRNICRTKEGCEILHCIVLPENFGFCLCSTTLRIWKLGVDRLDVFKNTKMLDTNLYRGSGYWELCCIFVCIVQEIELDFLL